MELALQIGITAFLVCLGLWGRVREKNHFKRLDAREAATAGFMVHQVKSFPHAISAKGPPKLIVAEAVIATDYLKSFFASLRNIFGGEMRSYQTLLTRARREAVLRIVDQARQEGSNAVCNLRLENADIGGNTSKRGTVMASILASATAYHQEPASPGQP